MKILHYSDWHGQFLEIDESYNIVVCSGDMMPNFNRAHPDDNKIGQERWIISKRAEFKKLIGDRKYLFLPGNHDFFDPIPLMRKMGFDAISINERTETIEGVSFYGFPWIPFLKGEWNYEALPSDMVVPISKVADAAPDVLVSHCPPFGYCDMTDHHANRAGNTQLTNLLMYGDWMPKMVLCGHLHESRGTAKMGDDCIVSNAATTYRILEV